MPCVIEVTAMKATKVIKAMKQAKQVNRATRAIKVMKVMKAPKRSLSMKAMKTKEMPRTISFENGNLIERRGVVGPVLRRYGVTNKKEYNMLKKLFQT